MRPNNIRTVWNAGQCVVNGWLAIPSAFSAEVMAHCGWDSLCIDIQHGMVDYQTATTMMQANFDHRSDADRARPLERSRHHHEVPRCRRLWRCLSHDQ
jgi:2-keto-3-deoxy-L-rhamnonate aldolase RhmA